MGLIFDSCIWVALAANQIDRQAVIEAARDAPVFTSVISLGQLRVLPCPPAQTPQSAPDAQPTCARLKAARRWACHNTPLPRFGVLAAAVKQAGRSPRPRYNDLWIAEQAIEHGYALLTLNTRDFEGLPGVRLVTLSPIAQG